MSHLGISAYLSDRVKRREYDGRCKENLPGPQAYFMDIVHFMHMVKEKNEGLLDDQMIRRGRSRAKAPRYTTRP